MRRLCVACALAIGTAGMAWAGTDDAPIAQSSAEAAPAPSASAARARKSQTTPWFHLLLIIVLLDTAYHIINFVGHHQTAILGT